MPLLASTRSWLGQDIRSCGWPEPMGALLLYNNHFHQLSFGEKQAESSLFYKVKGNGELQSFI